MGERIELPQQLSGDEQNQLKQLWSYLYQMAENLNIHLDAIGGNELTDDERKIVQAITHPDGETPAYSYSEMETLKSLIIKTAEFVQTSITEWRTTLLGETVAEGKFGRYVRQTGLDVAVNPEGITQNYSFQEIIQGLKVYEINAKNYIKSGLLRTVNSVPVYGVAIGKDIVTFSEDGTETYNDGNKVAELTADELSFWQGGYKVASYKGNKISFLLGGNEVFYVQSGKIYCVQDLEIASGKKLIINATNFAIDASGNVTIKGTIEIPNGKTMTVKSGGDLNIESGGDLDIRTGGKFTIQSGNFDIDASGNVVLKGAAEILSGKALKVKSGGELKVESGGDMNIESGGDLIVKSGANLKLQSGGVLDVNSNNFKLSSSDRKMEAGDWTFGKDGAEFHIVSTAPPFNKNGYFRIKKGKPPANREGSIFTGDDNSMVISCDYNDSTLRGTMYIYFDNQINSIGIAGVQLDFDSGSMGQGWMKVLPMYYNLYYSKISLGSSTNLFYEIFTDTLTYNHLNQLSSREVKHNIKALESSGEKLDELKPVTFAYNSDPAEETRAGLIWEDTVGVLPEICNEKDGVKSIDYVQLVPYLLKEIQDLRKRVAELERR